MKLKRLAIRKCCRRGGFFRDIFHQAMEASQRAVEKGDIAADRRERAHAGGQGRQALTAGTLPRRRSKPGMRHTKEIDTIQASSGTCSCNCARDVRAVWLPRSAGSENLIPSVNSKPSMLRRR